MKTTYNLFAFAMLVVALLCGNKVVAAQSHIGERLPDFSFSVNGSEAASLKQEGNRILVVQGNETATVSVLLVHFFQPDCLQCQDEMKALEATYQSYEQKGVLVIGVSHRDSREAAQSVTKRLKVTYPLLLGTGSEFAKTFAAGDALYIADNRGVIRFSQAGYGGGDEKLWRENIDLLLAGKPVAKETTERENLNVGDRLPTIELNSLMSGAKIALTGKDGRLTFTDENGKSIQPKAAVGLFSRYCAFTREEMGQLEKLHEKYANDGVFVFTIALHPKPEEAKATTRKLGVTYPVFEGHGSDLEKQYGYGCPAYIVDASGIVRYTQTGFEAGDEKKYEAEIKKLLEEK